MPIRADRSPHNPILHPGSDARIGDNLNGPSLIRVPDWVDSRLGRYYLYFAHHKGTFIRMAYADDVLGPYTVYGSGVLDIEGTPFSEHIASPEVIVDHDARVLRMLYHGAEFRGSKPPGLGQVTCIAESADGLRFASMNTCLGPAYMRVFSYGERHYAFNGGPARCIWRTADLGGSFERGPAITIEGEPYAAPGDQPRGSRGLVYRMRHPALHLRGHELDVYYSNVGDRPERIKRTTIDLRGEWTTWRGTPPVEILRSETDYEGAQLPDVPSRTGAANDPVQQLRDPHLFEDDGRCYLVYSVAGERGLAIAQLHEDGLG